jgi:Flp pilus assembly protein TadB
VTPAPLLLGLAVRLLLTQPAPERRLRALVPGAAPQSPRASLLERPRAVRAVCAVSGLGLGLALGGAAGVVVGALVALLLPARLLRLDDAAAKEDEEVAASLPLALDLLGACLAGGGSLVAVLSSVAQATPGPCGQRLSRVAAALVVGTPPEEAFRALGTTGPAGAAARALCRASEGGTPVAGAVGRVAAEARRAAVVESRKRAKRAGTLAVGPLGACFLPAFVLVGVAPAVIGLAAPLLRSL